MDREPLLAWLRTKAEEQANAAQHLGPDFGGNCETAADALRSAAEEIERLRATFDQKHSAAACKCGYGVACKAWDERGDEIQRLQSRLGKLQQTAAEQYAALTGRAERAESRLGSAEEQNRYLRKWIRELRDTQEERGQEPADPLYSMLLERIDPLVQADPAADSPEGVKLVALAELCEAYEKRKGSWPTAVEKHDPLTAEERQILDAGNRELRRVVLDDIGATAHRNMTIKCAAACEPMSARMGFYGICQLPQGHDGAHDSSIPPE